LPIAPILIIFLAIADPMCLDIDNIYPKFL